MEPLNDSHKLGLASTVGCSSLKQLERRRFLTRGIGLTAGALGGWTAVAEQLAISSASKSRDNETRPKNLIFLWLQGGPSQLETFDPHPGKKIGGSIKGVDTSLQGVQISDLLPQTAEVMHLATLVRSLTSKEGDHERATYTMKTGWRPDPTLIHPSIGSVLCHQTEGNIEIPRHISILASQWPARGGYMGPHLDAFQVGDPSAPIANLKSPVDANRRDRRLANLQSIAEAEFRKGRLKNLDAERTQQITATQRALKMMDSAQIEAFEISKEPDSVVKLFGDSSFGRGCLAAIRLVQQGVTCVEVELNGWDTHANNHGFHQSQCKILDAALHWTNQRIGATRHASKYDRRLWRGVWTNTHDQCRRRPRSLANRIFDGHFWRAVSAWLRARSNLAGRSDRRGRSIETDYRSGNHRGSTRYDSQLIRNRLSQELQTPVGGHWC